MKFNINLAKSDGTTMREHTDNNLESIVILKKSYKNRINQILSFHYIDVERFWLLLDIAAEYHDYGKFCNDMVEKLNTKNPKFKVKVIHNYLSPCFITKEVIDYYNLTKDELILIFLAIAYHHERGVDVVREDILDIIDNDLSHKLNNIKIHMKNNLIGVKLNRTYIGKIINQINEEDKNYINYVLIKGFLIKADHIASNKYDIDIEKYTNDNIGEYASNFLINNYGSKRELQVFCEANTNKNIILIGSTGFGKFEGCLLWIGNDKGILTIPLKVSLNDAQRRLVQCVGYKNAGLVHSSSLEYMESLDDGFNYINYENSKNLCNKLILSTIDQVLKFVFKYKGYEKEYSMFAYTKLVIDEIQAYNPELMAIVTKAVQMINNMGGRFMIMTATLPKFLYDEISKRTNSNFEFNQFLSEKKRHKIKLLNKGLKDDYDEIISKGKNSKVLVICNTSEKAKKVYRELHSKLNKDDINIIHSEFTKEDKSIKEKKIKDFNKDRSQNGIWIATQVVEASLDIDFDFLFTDMCSLDALFQRLGRIWRSRESNIEDYNIYIYTQEVTGIGYVYDKYIWESSLHILNKYDNQILIEKDKMSMIEELYSIENIKDTDYYKKYIQALQFLDNITERELKKKEVQEIFRNIDNYNVIPKDLYDEHLDLFFKFNDTSDKKEKANIYKEISKYIISVNAGKINSYKKKDRTILSKTGIDDIYIINKYYENEGINFDEEYIEIK